MSSRKGTINKKWRVIINNDTQKLGEEINYTKKCETKSPPSGSGCVSYTDNITDYPFKNNNKRGNIL